MAGSLLKLQLNLSFTFCLTNSALLSQASTLPDVSSLDGFIELAGFHFT